MTNPASPPDDFVRDFARLIVKYGSQTVAQGLRSFSATPVDDVARLLDGLAHDAVNPNAVPRTQRRRLPKRRLIPTKLDEELEDLRSGLLNRDLLPTASHLREYAAAIGIKGSVPKDRRAAVRSVITHLGALAPEARARAIVAIGRAEVRDPHSPYVEWTRTILGDAPSGTDEAARLEAEVRREIGRLSGYAFRAIKLDQGEREAFEDLVFRACCQLGWEPPQISINPVNPEQMDLGWVWREGAFTISSRDPDALRGLVESRSRIALQIRDTRVGRLFRETYMPKVSSPPSI